MALEWYNDLKGDTLMDGTEFFNLMKNIYTTLKCPACGEIYAIEEIQLMGHFDGFFLMQMTCSKCKLPVSVNFYTAKDNKEQTGDLKLVDLKNISQETITTDEVIAFHSGLNKFDGDLKKALSKGNKSK